MNDSHSEFPSETTSIPDAVTDDDRTWFEQHPGATLRMRPYELGESPVIGPVLPTHTLVTQLAPGVRMRESMVAPDHCQGHEVLLYEAHTGRVRGLYLDRDQELTLLRRYPKVAPVTNLADAVESRRSRNGGSHDRRD